MKKCYLKIRVGTRQCRVPTDEKNRKFVELELGFVPQPNLQF